MVALRPFFGAARAQPEGPAGGPGLGALARAGDPGGARAPLRPRCPALIERTLVAPMVLAVDGAAMQGHLALWHGIGHAAAAQPRHLRARRRCSTSRSTASATGWPPPSRGCRAPRAGTTRRSPGSRPSRARSTGGGAERADDQLPAQHLPGRSALLIWGALCGRRRRAGRRFAVRAELIDWAIIGIIAASIAVVLRTHSRLTAIAALGGVGAGIAIVFVLYGAIDVAMTQLFVEILVVVFLAIAMVRLPPSRRGAVPRRQRARSRRCSGWR